MTFSFKKGTHRARPLYWLRWWPLLVRPRKISRKVMFWFDSRYELPGGDQDDVNKLFGVAFGRVHRNSARFGWRYDPGKKKFILSAYVYRDGERFINDLCECTINHWYRCQIVINGSYAYFTVYNENGQAVGYSTASAKSILFGWLLGPYFGGNRTAPVHVTIELSK